MSNNTGCIEGPIQGEVKTFEKLLQLQDVGKEFPMNDGTKLVCLRGLSLTIKDIENKPQIVSLLGPSGAGKTTALRIIAALDKPTTGSVTITNGQPDQMRPVKLGDVGVVFQRYPLFDDLNVLNNLTAPATRAGINAKDANDKALK